MSSISVINNGADTAAPQTRDASEVHNAFMIILYMYLRDIKNQDEATDAGLDKELFLMSQFNNQNAVVKDKQKALQALIGDSGKPAVGSVQEIQAAMSLVQAEQAKLLEIRGEMSRVFKVEIDPCQDMIRQNSIMFGAMVKNYVITERTR